MGSLESAVLEVLWDSDAALKPAAVLDGLEMTPALSYSTVVTVLRRLEKKGLVARAKQGKTYLYRARRSREEQVALAMADVFSSAADPSAALGHFVDHLSADQTSALKRVLGRRR